MFPTARLVEMEDSWFPEDGPTLMAEPEMLRALATALVEAGFGPESREEAEMRGAHEAQGKHLEDMRTLVFDGAGLLKPGG